MEPAAAGLIPYIEEGEYVEEEPERITGIPALYELLPRTAGGRQRRGISGGDAKFKFNDDIETRQQAVSILMARGETAREIWEHLAVVDILNPNDGLPWTLETIKRDMKTVAAEWKKEARKSGEEHVAAALAKLNEVERVAWSRGDMSSVMAAIDRECKILGIYAAERVQVMIEDRADELAKLAGVDKGTLMKVAVSLSQGKAP